MDAKAEVARKKAAEEQTREHLQMEAELAARRREAARARIDGKASGASSVIESSAYCPDRCRANMAHTRQSRPDPGLAFQVKVFIFSRCYLFARWQEIN